MLPARASVVCLLLSVLSVMSGLVPAGAAAAATTPTQHNTCSRTSVGAPRCGVLWGSYVSPRGSGGRGAWRQPYGALESRVGRRFDLVKAYVGWDAHTPFPTDHQRALVAGGRLLEVSWNAYNYSRRQSISYRRIARGDYDASLVRPQARLLARWGRRVVVDFQHEMDGRHVRRGTGTPADYRAAFRHVVRVFRSVGATNVKWAWISTGYRPSRIAPYWPGRAFVQWIGYDPYNFASCNGTRWRSPARALSRFYSWVTSRRSMRGKPIMLGEYGTVDDRRSGAWYRQVPAALRAHPRIKAVIQFSSAPSPSCSFRVTDRASTLRGFAAAGHSAAVLGR